MTKACPCLYYLLENNVCPFHYVCSAHQQLTYSNKAIIHINQFLLCVNQKKHFI